MHLFSIIDGCVCPSVTLLHMTPFSRYVTWQPRPTQHTYRSEEIRGMRWNEQHNTCSIEHAPHISVVHTRAPVPLAGPDGRSAVAKAVPANMGSALFLHVDSLALLSGLCFSSVLLVKTLTNGTKADRNSHDYRTFHTSTSGRTRIPGDFRSSRHFAGVSS